MCFGDQSGELVLDVVVKFPLCYPYQLTGSNHQCVASICSWVDSLEIEWEQGTSYGLKSPDFLGILGSGFLGRLGGKSRKVLISEN